MASLLALSAGCMEFLPAGDPPEGDIVKNEPAVPAPESPRARENRLVTELIVCALSHCPGSAWSLRCDPECLALGERLMKAAAETAGIRRGPEGTPGCFTLQGRMEKERDSWSLISPAGARIWQGR